MFFQRGVLDLSQSNKKNGAHTMSYRTKNIIDNGVRTPRSLVWKDDVTQKCSLLGNEYFIFIWVIGTQSKALKYNHLEGA